MSVSINDFRMAIRIDNSDAKGKLIETKDQVAAIRAEMDKLAAEGKKDTKEYKELEKTADKMNRSVAEQRKEVGLCGLSYAELRKGAAQLKREMDRATPGTEKWKKLRADYRLTKQRMKELDLQAQETRFSISKVTDGFNKYAAIGASAIASLTGVALTARKCVDEYAEMQEAEAQVIKYTGMTKDAVADLNEEFKQMDTRTAREKLNALAGDAGRLGIKGKKDVLEFVDAADKINVALGEDLGEDAVKNIGKLAQMFGEDDKLGLRGAMLATGSAINEVAQNSSAAEAYLVGFTARVAGAANQAKVAQGDIIGYASVLDQNMQQQEMAATAFQTLMMKMYQEPAKFAKLSGKSVKEFTDLIKNDANEAILQFLETLNKKGGLDQLAPMFKEMGLDGVRASGVISTMAGKIDDIRAAQKLANDAYRDGTSIIKEFDVQNNTVQAGLDKAKKEFKDIRVELGEKLLPVMKYMVTTGSMTVKGLGQLVSIFSEYKKAILVGVITITTYIAVKKLHWFWLNKVKTETGEYIIVQKLKQVWDKAVTASTILHSAATSALTGNLKMAKLAMEAFFRVTKTHPLALLLSAIVAISGAIYLFVTRTKNAKTATEELLSSISQERNELNKIHNQLLKTNEKTAERTRLINEFNSQFGKYLTNLLDEKSTVDDIKKAYREATAAMNDHYARELLASKQSDIVRENIDEQSKSLKNAVDYAVNATKEQKARLSELINDVTNQVITDNPAFGKGNVRQQIYEQINREFGVGSAYDLFGGSSGWENFSINIAPFINGMDKTINKINKLKDELSPFIKDLSESVDGDGDGKCPICGNKPCTCNKDGGGSTLNKELKAREEALKQAMLTEQNLWKKEYLDKQHTEEEYQQALYDSEMMFLLEKKALLEEYGQNTSDIQRQIFDKTIAEADRLKKTQENKDKESKDKYLKEIETNYLKKQQELKQRYINSEIKTEVDLQEKMKQLELDYLNKRKNALAKYGDDVIKINGQIQDKVISQMKESADKAKKAEEEEKNKDRDDFYTRTDNEYVNCVIDSLQFIFATKQQHWESEEEYKERMKDRDIKRIKLIGQVAALASQSIQSLQDSEINKVTRKYDKQISAAKKAGKDTTKLEEEKEEAINQVKKKYADKQFAAAVLQVTASTAVAAMEAYKAMAGIPIIGPALGAIAAAAAVASGGAQIAVAKQQRDEAKGLKSGGFSNDYVEGYTSNGNPDDVAGVIPVHKNEFVTNHEGVANPHVRQFLDVFDIAQKNGTIRMINTTQILEQIRTHSGKYSGGYTEEVYTNLPNGGTSLSEMSPQDRSQIVKLLFETNRILKIICDKELIVDARKMRDEIKRVERLEKNVSR